MFVIMYYLQAQHIDLEYYEAKYKPGVYPTLYTHLANLPAVAYLRSKVRVPKGRRLLSPR